MSDIVFNLTKDEVFSLTKLDPGIDNFFTGLYWVPAISGADVDLDVILIATGDNDKVISGMHAESFCYYDNHGRDNTPPAAFFITEDDRDGVNSSDSEYNEAIYTTSSEINPGIKNLHIFVTFHEPNGRSLKDIESVGLCIAPVVDGNPDFNNQIIYDVLESGSSVGAHMCTFTRNSVKGWDVKAVGSPVGDLGSIARSYGIGTK